MIKITTQPALIGIERQEGQLSIQQNQHPMELSTTAPKLNLQIEDAVLHIDQSQCFAEAGLKNHMELTRAFTAKAKQKAIQAIGRIASEGQQMADIHRGNAIGRIAKQRSTTKEKQFDFDMIPKSRPQITVQEGRIDSSLERGTVDIQMGDYRPQIDFQPDKVEVYLRQKNSINIEYVGNHLDTYGG
ncbi:DUF6470 family protein [Alkaliphilus hydrothermalis]|uniref:Adhesin domain-containing protein n=1 Tax=Alkaliphilus hydrothermalis TaxID=1482730 RepID=A0ABS2NR13_9FIRM|nr:DUF6470 family protein [Alkaliphilus hydrothermalis]MBM7615370.1 hypothetical protein [Alkaliphilus hydrothermalis]